MAHNYGWDGIWTIFISRSAMYEWNGSFWRFLWQNENMIVKPLTISRQNNVRIGTTFMHICITTVATQQQLVSHILSMYVCSLSYTACKLHVPYYIVICGLSGCTILLHIYLINSTIFGKKVIGHKICVLISSTTFVSNVSHSKNNPARY